MINPSSPSPDLPDDAPALPPIPAPPPPPPIVPASVAARPKPPGASQHARGFVRLLYTQNPFYVISAALVLWGLRLSFDTSAGDAFDTHALIGGLAGYTLLLAAAACFLIRYARLWQDVRSVLLLMVLMFLAMSISLEDTLMTNPGFGTVAYLGGLVFAIALSEAVLRIVRLSLPVLFRMPYYLILALLFLYPVLVHRYVGAGVDSELHWLLFLFSPMAGVVFLGLLPAVRRGPQYVRGNGSPWPWPAYPWTLFGVLALGIGMRSYCLCMSFPTGRGPSTVFAPYTLVPFLFCLNVLLLEIGLVSHLKRVRQLALVVPLGLAALAITGPAAAMSDFGFLEDFIVRIGASPLFCTLVAAAGFYAVAMLRRVPSASFALTLTLAALTVCGPETVDRTTLVSPQGWPLAAAAMLLLVAALWRRSSARCLIAACCAVLALTLELRETQLMAWQGAIPVHLLLAAVLIVGATFRDDFARALRCVGAVLLAMVSIAAVTLDPSVLGGPPPTVVTLYPFVVAAVAVVYRYLVRERIYWAAAWATLGCWGSVVGWHEYRTAREVIAGLDYLAAGILFFALAMLISLAKIGLPQRWLARLWRFIRGEPAAVLDTRAADG